MFFSQDWRERIKTENPDAGFGAFVVIEFRLITDYMRIYFLLGEIGKLLGAKWKELDDSEKKVCPLL